MACAIGKYNDLTGRSDISVCKSCVAGKACMELGMGAEYYDTSVEATTYPQATTRTMRETFIGHPAYPDCAAGFFCTIGSISTHPYVTVPNEYGPCGIGNYCPAGSTEETPCPIGTWSNQKRATSKEYCLACPPGYKCETTGLSEPETLCDVGWTCYTTWDWTDSAATEGVISLATCSATGSYCPLGSHRELICPTGYYND